jgi:hypothetical protein
MTLKIINCYACYDFGEVIDKFDQGKRERLLPRQPNRLAFPGVTFIV